MRKFVTARRSQVVSSYRRMHEQMQKTEEDIQPIDIEFWTKAEEKRQRKAIKRLRNDAMMIVRQ